MLMKILPYMLPVFSFTMPAALVVYFVVSNLFRIGQQAYITRSLYRGEDSPGCCWQSNAEQLKKDDVDHESSGGRTTAKKGAPTPKRDGSLSGKGKGKKPAPRKNVPSRSSGKKETGRSRGKGTPAKPAAKPKASSPKPRRTGAGRTGNAPTRHHRGSGRTTDPGSPQHKKRKK